MADGSWFGGQHGPEGAWKSLKGPMLAPHLQMPLESGNTGDPRFNGQVEGPMGWEASLKPREGLTGPGGTLAKK
jgi:hypothetical protein